jgi:glutamyl-tRNA(Gln) amidotransferase subunit E
VVTGDELSAIVDRIVADRAEFVRERGMGALGPLMGVVMAEVRGSADGKKVAGLLREAIAGVIG